MIICTWRNHLQLCTLCSVTNCTHGHRLHNSLARAGCMFATALQACGNAICYILLEKYFYITCNRLLLLHTRCLLTKSKTRTWTLTTIRLAHYMHDHTGSASGDCPALILKLQVTSSCHLCLAESYRQCSALRCSRPHKSPSRCLNHHALQPSNITR
jgi:hypothetical protein